ncbi:hypothetical protein GG344DRAFT_71103 [Lentinula edodes]|nr:hypothetical protein GG344DRAFT_71103 [Lentinula edodes]
MYLFFTAMLVNVLVFAAPTPPSRRVGTNRLLLSNKIGFAPDQQFVLFIGDRHSFQYHPDTDRISAEIDIVDFKTFGSSPRRPEAPFIQLGTDHEQDIFINFDEKEIMTIKKTSDTMSISGLGGFLGLIQNVEKLRTTTGYRFTSDLQYVDAVFTALMNLVRADGKTKLLEFEDYKGWQDVLDYELVRRMMKWVDVFFVVFLVFRCCIQKRGYQGGVSLRTWGRKGRMGMGESEDSGESGESGDAGDASGNRGDLGFGDPVKPGDARGRKEPSSSSSPASESASASGSTPSKAFLHPLTLTDNPHQPLPPKFLSIKPSAWIPKDILDSTRPVTFVFYIHLQNFLFTSLSNITARQHRVHISVHVLCTILSGTKRGGYGDSEFVFDGRHFSTFHELFNNGIKNIDPFDQPSHQVKGRRTSEFYCITHLYTVPLLPTHPNLIQLALQSGLHGPPGAFLSAQQQLSRSSCQ